MISLLVACHYRQQIVHAAAQIPFKKCTAALRVYIKVLLIAFDNQFILAVAVKVNELVALPVSVTKTYAVSSILGLDEVMIDSGTHVTHVDTTKQAMPVSIVGLRLPQLHNSRIFCRTCSVDSIMDTQHFLVLVVDLWITY